MPLPAADSPYQVRLDACVVMITGASGGLGRPLALGCAARGATVLLHGRIARKLDTPRTPSPLR
jgi:short-subunit dehydrogenase